MSGLFYHKSYFFKSEQVYDLLNEIRMRYPHAHIILIGYMISIYINYYLKRYFLKTQIISGKNLDYKYKCQVYFIINHTFLNLSKYMTF